MSVPSDEDLQHIYDNASGGHEEGMFELWLVGYHARDSRIAELEAEVRQLVHAKLDAETMVQNEHKLYADAWEQKERLEAEVAELREQLEQADAYHEAADELAYAIASPEQIGEHTSANSPWKRALEWLETEREACAQLVSRLEAREPTREECEEALGAKDECFALGRAIRRCIDCRVPVTGGPTRCVACAERSVAPRRTPELTERVAYLIERCMYKAPCKESLTETAVAILDVVFG